VAVTIHALLRKREVAAVTGWIGLAWLAPVIGPILYLCLGVNRIQRKGISLGLREVWDHRKAPEKIQEDEMRTAELSRRYPTFVGLARLGEQVTGHPILPGNAVAPLVNGDEAYPQMLAAIDEATNSVNLLSYIFDSDRSGEQFLAALKRACARRVEVRVLIDSVGAAYSKPNMASKEKVSGTFFPLHDITSPFHNIFRKSRHGKIRISPCSRAAPSLHTTSAFAGRYSWKNVLSGRRSVLSTRFVPFTSIATSP
jgi:cardiolipin synthase